MTISYEQAYMDLAAQGLRQSREAQSVSERGAAEGKKSWLAVMMEGLQEEITSSFNQMKGAADNVTKTDPSTMVDFQVKSQEFSLLMNTAQTVVKTVGEANSAAARKQ